MKLPKIDWKKNQGLVPAIVQDAATQQVLMLGYMDAAALRQTLRTKKVTFFSRSKQRLWEKARPPGTRSTSSTSRSTAMPTRC
jgi:phosphoribosyl-ATP pyrophosphohydrolase/phosphoribosyl-AMP cyclohydrolase